MDNPERPSKGDELFVNGSNIQQASGFRPCRDLLALCLSVPVDSLIIRLGDAQKVAMNIEFNNAKSI